MMTFLLLIAIVGIAGLAVLVGACFYFARKAEDERLQQKRDKEEQELLNTSLEELVDKELEERYKANNQTYKKEG